MHIVEHFEVENPMFRIDVTHDEDTGSTTYEISHSFENKQYLCKLLRDFITRNGG